SRLLPPAARARRRDARRREVPAARHAVRGRAAAGRGRHPPAAPQPPAAARRPLMTPPTVWHRFRSLLPDRSDYAQLRTTWRGDLVAGVTVGIVALPLALG